MHIVASFIITLVIFLALGRIIQLMGTYGLLFATPPANMYGLVTARGVEGDVALSGGNVVDVVHAVPGQRLIKPSHDQMEWYFFPGKEPRGLLFKILGVVWLGPYKGLRINTIRTFRYGRKEGETEYRLMPKDDESKWAHFSGQHDMYIADAETKDTLAVNLKLNLMYVDTQPVKARLKVADANAVLSIRAEKKANAVTKMTELDTLVSGDETIMTGLEKKVMEIADEVQTKIGMTLTSADVFEISMNAETRKLYELKETRKREMEAEVAASEANIQKAANEAEAAVKTAEGERRARMLMNEAEADHITKVIAPIALNPNRVRVREAEAYENNETVTTFAPGGQGVGIFKQAP